MLAMLASSCSCVNLVSKDWLSTDSHTLSRVCDTQALT